MALLFALGSAAAAPLCAQSGTATLSARVTDLEGRPLPGAGVWVDGRSALSDARGRATIKDIRPGPHLVRVRADGYQAEAVALEFGAGAAVEVETELQRLPDVIALPIITVEVERQIPHLRNWGYYSRKQAGSGHFLERDENAPWDRVPYAAMLFYGVPGFKVVYGRSGYVIHSTRGVSGLRSNECVPAIVVDGFPWPDDLGSIPPSDIQAIETYSGPATSPPQFAFTANGLSCGMILIWRRRGPN